jgi:hypothetical protein
MQHNFLFYSIIMLITLPSQHLRKLKTSNFNWILFSSSFPLILFHVKFNHQTSSGHLRYTRSSNFNYGPYHHSSIYPHHSFAAMGSPYYHRDMEDPISPALPGHHRSRSASRPPVSHTMDYPSNLSLLCLIVIFLSLLSMFLLCSQEHDINRWIEVA